MGSRRRQREEAAPAVGGTAPEAMERRATARSLPQSRADGGPVPSPEVEGETPLTGSDRLIKGTRPEDLPEQQNG